jgi:hypothetical protein
MKMKEIRVINVFNFSLSGSFSVFKYLIGVMSRVRRGENSNGNNDDSSGNNHPLQSLITCFLCGWFITGKGINCIFSPSLPFSLPHSLSLSPSILLSLSPPPSPSLSPHPTLTPLSLFCFSLSLPPFLFLPLYLYLSPDLSLSFSFSLFLSLSYWHNIIKQFFSPGKGINCKAERLKQVARIRFPVPARPTFRVEMMALFCNPASGGTFSSTAIEIIKWVKKFPVAQAKVCHILKPVPRRT